MNTPVRDKITVQTVPVVLFFVQIFVKLVDNTENFCNFVIGNHRFLFCNLFVLSRTGVYMDIKDDVL